MPKPPRKKAVQTDIDSPTSDRAPARRRRSPAAKRTKRAASPQTVARRVPTRPLRHDDVREVEQLAPLVPVRQIQERVHTEQQTQRPVGEFRPEARERIERI